MAEKCFQIIIRGNVQSVFFRKFTKIAAQDFEIKGFVRNEYDGSVYIEAQGENSQLEKFIAWCHRGPEHAQVERVEVIEVELKNFSAFSISFF